VPEAARSRTIFRDHPCVSMIDFAPGCRSASWDSSSRAPCGSPHRPMHSCARTRATRRARGTTHVRAIRLRAIAIRARATHARRGVPAGARVNVSPVAAISIRTACRTLPTIAHPPGTKVSQIGTLMASAMRAMTAMATDTSTTGTRAELSLGCSAIRRWSAVRSPRATTTGTGSQTAWMTARACPADVRTGAPPTQRAAAMASTATLTAGRTVTTTAHFSGARRSATDVH
jgi:hypothetical protein